MHPSDQRPRGTASDAGAAKDGAASRNASAPERPAEPSAPELPLHGSGSGSAEPRSSPPEPPAATPRSEAAGLDSEGAPSDPEATAPDPQPAGPFILIGPEGERGSSETEPGEADQGPDGHAADDYDPRGGGEAGPRESDRRHAGRREAAPGELLVRVARLVRERRPLPEALTAAIELLRAGLSLPVARARWQAEVDPEAPWTHRWWGEADRVRPLREAADASAGQSPALANAFDGPSDGSAGVRWIQAVPEAMGAERARAARQGGLRGALRFPVRAEDRVVAVVELFGEASINPESDAWRAVELARAMLDGHAARERARAAVRHAAGHVRRLSDQLEPTVRRLREMEERYALICRAAAEGVWDWDLDADRVFFSPRWKAILGHAAAEIGDGPSEWMDRIHPEDRERVELEIREHLAWQSPRLETEHRLRHADGRWRRVLVRGLALRDAEGKANRLAGSLADVTEEATEPQTAFDELFYHALTGLPTRPLLLDRLDLAIRRRTRRPDRSFAVLCVWLDGIREVASVRGPEAADHLLGHAARGISALLRPGDTVAHTGEDEFAVLLEEIGDLDTAVRVGRRVESSLTREFPLDGEPVTLAPYVGVALARSGHERPEELLRDAGIAMRRGRRRETSVQVFDGASPEPDAAAEALGRDLRRAFPGEELHLEYQPIVSLDDGRITGLEALLRWPHPSRGPIPPAELLPLAEEEGLLEEIGFWVLERACRQLLEWDDRLTLSFPPTIAVNVTERQLHDPTFVERSVAVVDAAGLDPGRVRFDIPEGVLTRDVQRTAHVLESLRDRGIRAAIDDFGTGHASLGYLHRFPVGTIKIDRSLVSGKAAKEQDLYLARTVVELARVLELEVIAEGIETREQFLRLREMGCRQGQGYFFSGPVPAETAELLVRDGYPLDLSAPAR